MNSILNAGQGNTKKGAITRLASVDLTGKENQLLKIVDDGGVAKFALPTAITDICPYICMSGDVAGNEVAAEVPNTGEQCRVLLDGTCSAGDMLAPSATYGKVRKPAGSSGATNYMFIAEEAGVDGQLVLCRFIGFKAVTP